MRRAERAAAALLAALLGACGGAPPGIDARDLVEGQRLLGGTEAPSGDAPLEALLALAAARPCAVRAALLVGDEPHAAPAPVLAAIDARAREFCDAGFRDEPLELDASGAVRAARTDLRVGDGYLLVGGPVAGATSWMLPAHAEAPATATCLGDDVRAAGTVRIEAGGAATLRAEGGERLVAVRGDGRVLGCEGDGAVHLRASATPYRLYAHGSASEAVRVEVGPPSTSQVVWRPGAARYDMSIALSGLTRAAPTSPGMYCSGFLPDLPTVVVEVAEPGWISIWLDTDGDPVLWVRDGAGNAQCNDDWNNLQSRVEMNVSPGTLEVYAGTFGRSGEAVGQLFIE